MQIVAYSTFLLASSAKRGKSTGSGFSGKRQICESDQLEEFEVWSNLKKLEDVGINRPLQLER